MSDEPEKEVPEAVRKTIVAMVGQALAQCDREGIAHEDFYAALQKEEKLLPRGTLTELFRRTFRRLKGLAN
jgi:hypothetical protein